MAATTLQRFGHMTSAGLFEDVTMTDAPPLPGSVAPPNTPRAAERTEQRNPLAERTEQRNPLSERLLNACVPVIRRNARRSLGGKENKVGASVTPSQRRRSPIPTQPEESQTSTEAGRGLLAVSPETFVLDDFGMIVETLGASDPLETFRFDEEPTEAEEWKEARGVSRDDLGADSDDDDVMEKYIRILRKGSGGLRMSGGGEEKRRKPFWMRRLGWRNPSAQELGLGARFGPGRANPVGDEMVFTSEEERRRFFRYYPDGKVFPERNKASDRATWQEKPMKGCHVSECVRKEIAFPNVDEIYDDSWKMETLLAQGRKLDDLSMLAEEFVSNGPYLSARAATWLKDMDARRGPLDLLGGSPPGHVACGRCGRKGSPEQMTKCKGGVTSCLLGGKKRTGAENGACEIRKGAPGKCGRELCGECGSECAQCGEAVCGKHCCSSGFGCSGLRFCLTCAPSSTDASRAADVTGRHLPEAFPCPLCR